MLFLPVAVTQILPNPQFSQEGMHYDYNAIAFKTIKEMKEACTQYGTKDNKTFLSHQCKEIVENNRIGKNRNLFKDIRDTKGTFHAKMSTIKDRNGKDLTEQNILRRGGKNTQKYTKKDLQDPDNHDGVITHIEPDILECEVTWALGSITTIKASVCDGIPSSNPGR